MLQSDYFEAAEMFDDMAGRWGIEPNFNATCDVGYSVDRFFIDLLVDDASLASADGYILADSKQAAIHLMSALDARYEQALADMVEMDGVQ